MKYFYFFIFFSFFSKFYGVDQDLTQQDLTQQDLIKKDLRGPCESAILDLSKELQLTKQQEQKNVYNFVNQLIGFEDFLNYIKNHDCNHNQYASSLKSIKSFKDFLMKNNQNPIYNVGLKLETLIPPIEAFVASVLNQIQESSKDDLEKIVFHLLHTVQSEKKNAENTINELNQSQRNAENTINELNQSQRNAENTINDLKNQLILEKSKQEKQDQSVKKEQDLLAKKLQSAESNNQELQYKNQEMEKKIKCIIKQAQKKKRKNRELEKKIIAVQKNHADEVDQCNQKLISLESQYHKLQQENLNIKTKNDDLNEMHQKLIQEHQRLLKQTSQFCDIWKTFQNEMPYLIQKIETKIVKLY